MLPIQFNFHKTTIEFECSDRPRAAAHKRVENAIACPRRGQQTAFNQRDRLLRRVSPKFPIIHSINLRLTPHDVRCLAHGFLRPGFSCFVNADVPGRMHHARFAHLRAGKKHELRLVSLCENSNLVILQNEKVVQITLAKNKNASERKCERRFFHAACSW